MVDTRGRLLEGGSFCLDRIHTEFTALSIWVSLHVVAQSSRSSNLGSFWRRAGSSRSRAFTYCSRLHIKRWFAPSLARLLLPRGASRTFVRKPTKIKDPAASLVTPPLAVLPTPLPAPPVYHSPMQPQHPAPSFGASMLQYAGMGVRS